MSGVTAEAFCEPEWVTVHEVRRLWIRKKQASKSDSVSYVCKLNEQQISPWKLSGNEVETFFPSHAETLHNDWVSLLCENAEKVGTVKTKFHITHSSGNTEVFKPGDFIVKVKDGTYHRASGSWFSVILVADGHAKNGAEGEEEKARDNGNGKEVSRAGPEIDEDPKEKNLAKMPSSGVTQVYTRDSTRSVSPRSSSTKSTRSGRSGKSGRSSDGSKEALKSPRLTHENSGTYYFPQLIRLQYSFADEEAQVISFSYDGKTSSSEENNTAKRNLEDKGCRDEQDTTTSFTERLKTIEKKQKPKERNEQNKDKDSEESSSSSRSEGKTISDSGKRRKPIREKTKPNEERIHMWQETFAFNFQFTFSGEGECESQSISHI